MAGKKITYENIVAAQTIITEAGLSTPARKSLELSKICGTEVYLKLENLQPTGSFKVRGALLKLSGLSKTEKKQGIVAMSAGNHAQGVAYYARNLGIKATIVMPLNTPFTKISRTESLGAKVVLAGESLSDSRKHAFELSKSKGYVFIHPYDDPNIIIGQGTTGLEFLERFPELDTLIVPIGGGGLIAGVAIAAKGLNSKIDIIGVEATGYASMKASLAGQKATFSGQTVAEGIAVKAAGKITRKIIAENVSDILLANERHLEQAMQLYLQEQRLVVEGAGAASLAALLANKPFFQGKKVGLFVSGGNVDARLLSAVLLRGLVRDGKLIRLRIEIPDDPGQLSHLTEIIGDNGGNIVEVNHQRVFFNVPLKSTEVDVTLETRDRDHVDIIQKSLKKAGYPSLLLSNSI